MGFPWSLQESRCESSLTWLEGFLDFQLNKLDMAFRAKDSCIYSDHVSQQMARPRGRRRRIPLKVLKWENVAKEGLANRSQKAVWDQNYLFNLLEIML